MQTHGIFVDVRYVVTPVIHSFQYANLHYQHSSLGLSLKAVFDERACLAGANITPDFRDSFSSQAFQHACGTSTHHLRPLKAHIHKLRHTGLTQPRHLRIRHLPSYSFKPTTWKLMYRCLRISLCPVFGRSAEGGPVREVVLGDFGVLGVVRDGFVKEGLERD